MPNSSWLASYHLQESPKNSLLKLVFRSPQKILGSIFISSSNNPPKGESTNSFDWAMPAIEFKIMFVLLKRVVLGS
jgi:hypothetical protein